MQGKIRIQTLGKPITYEQAKLFKENYHFPALVGIQLNGPRSIQVKYENKETNPNTTLVEGMKIFY